jgi:TPR repeat protein
MTHAPCFLLWDRSDDGLRCLQRAAHMGYAPAQGRYAPLAGRARDEGRVFWARKAADQGERNGLFELGHCMYTGIDGCEWDTHAAIALLRKAAELGHVDAQEELAQKAYDKRDWQRYYWLRKASLRRDRAAEKMVIFAGKFLGGSGRIVYELGATFKGHVRESEKTILELHGNKREMHAAINCVRMYEAWLEEARDAIRCWLIVGRRKRVVKDIRNVIACMLWEQRAEWSEVEVDWRIVVLR